MDSEDAAIVIITATLVAVIIGGIVQQLVKFLTLSLIVGIIVFIVDVAKLPNFKQYYHR